MQLPPIHKSNCALAFGPFVLESDDLLRVNDRRVHLFPKQLEALKYLALRSGKVVAKDELLSHVWRDAFVSEGSLHQCISAIRKQLSDTAGGLGTIETIAKRGYRFLLPVTVVIPDEMPKEENASTLRVGILHFDCKAVADPPDHAMRLAARVAALLSQLRILGLEVANESALDRISADPQVAAKHLGLGLLVTGHLFSEDRKHLGAEAEILKASDQTLLSCRVIPPADPELLVNRLAGCIIRQLPFPETGIDRDEIAEAIEAGEEFFSLYLKGLMHIRGMFSPCFEGRREEDPRLAIRFFSQATERNSKKLASLIGLANSAIFANGRGLISADEAMRLGMQSSDAALAIDPRSAGARAASAVLKWIFEDEQDSGERDLRSVLDECPFHFTATEFLAMALMRDGRLTEAIEVLQDSLEHRPNNAIFRSWLVYGLFLDRRFESALREATTCAELFPDWEVAWAHLCFIAAYCGNYRSALEAGNRLSKSTSNGSLLALEAYGLAQAGERQRAEELADYILSFNRDASVHSAVVPALIALGKTRDALNSLEQANNLHDLKVPLVLIDPRLDPIRSHRRFLRVKNRYPRLDTNQGRRSVRSASDAECQPASAGMIGLKTQDNGL
jgi:DNA-binding winged helix-turn-helix (wHTH) protein/tetratricopeptide (TPR) repeat protein